MTATKARTLGDPFDRFVESQVASGAYESAEAVLRAGLTLLERRERKKADLREALSQGEESADFQEIDWDRFLRGEGPPATSR